MEALFPQLFNIYSATAAAMGQECLVCYQLEQAGLQIGTLEDMQTSTAPSMIIS